jgi:diketogulonate reductase-like aldo/keto reductase
VGPRFDAAIRPRLQAKHLAEDLQIYDFELSATEMSQIEKEPSAKSYRGKKYKKVKLVSF